MPNILCAFILSILCIVLAPILAIKVVKGTKIIKAGIFINPRLKGIFAFKYNPETKKPIEPDNEITKPTAAALPIALLIE